MFFALMLFSAASLQESRVLPKSEPLTVVAQEIADTQGLPYQVTVFIPEEWQAHRVVNAKIYFGNNGYAAILISPLLVDGMDAQAIRAVLAHELGHTQIKCGPRYTSDNERLECESRADAFSARVVGRRNAIRALCQMVAIGWDERIITDATDVYARIRKLHYLNDVP